MVFGREIFLKIKEERMKYVYALISLIFLVKSYLSVPGDYLYFLIMAVYFAGEFNHRIALDRIENLKKVLEEDK